MNWISITPDDLNDTKVAALVDACRTKALGSGQTDPAPRIIENAVARIRSEIKGCAANILDRDMAKIPKDLKPLTMRMIVRELESRLQIELKDDEREEWRHDLRYLERIARCEIPVLAPDNPETVESVHVPAGTPLICPKKRFLTRQKMEGV
jgi:hypothetical protein